MDEKDDEVNKIQEAIDRLKKIFRWIFLNIRKNLKCVKDEVFIKNKRENSESIKDENNVEEYLIETTHSRNSSSKTKKSERNYKDQVIEPNNEIDQSTSKLANLRKLTFMLVEQKNFELFIIIMIIFSSISLVTFFLIHIEIYSENLKSFF